MNEENIQQITESTNAISQWSKSFLSNLGAPDGWINLLNMAFLLAIVVVLVIALQHITQFIVKGVFKKMAKLPKMSFLKNLINRRFPHFVSMIVPFSLVKGTMPIIFDSYPAWMKLANTAADIYLIFYIIWLVMSVLNAFGDTLKSRDGFKDKPVESYIQVVKIFFYFIGFVIVISILTGKNPMYFITGLGAASAVLMLIFKDTILGFVASIQISANDMVRIGDWITVPKYDADGDVIQITLTTVKIRNFDKTITTIPPYLLVSESFQNWRGMVDTGGRRLKRAVYIKQSSIRFLTETEVKELEKIQNVTQYIQSRRAEIDDFNQSTGADKSLIVNGRNLTNMGLFRKYVENYLRNHPGVSDQMLLLVRQLQPTSKGLPLELYFFTSTTAWTEYENIVSDVFDHVASAVKYFDLELFEDISNPVLAQHKEIARQ